MKKSNFILIALLFIINFASAQEVLYRYKFGYITGEYALTDIDSIVFHEPAPAPIPVANYDETKLITIADLKNLAPNLPYSSVYKITDEYYVKAVITANDESGNIYKFLYIEDQTGGIRVPIDKIGLYKMYPVGQTIYIKCKDLYLGNSYGILQFGGIYNNGPGRIVLSDSLKIEDVVMPDGLPI